MQNPRFMNTMNTEFLKKEIKGIVGFEMTIEDVQAKKKWSQNRKDADYKNIIQELEQSDNPQSKEMAEQMKKNRPHI